jgi:hypothetical protein
VSQIEMYQHCGERWRLRYVEKISEPSSPPLIRGRAVHAAVADDLRSKRDSGALLHSDDLDAIVSEQVDGGFTQEVKLEPEEAARGLSRVKGETKDVALRLSRLHHAGPARVIKPASVEEKIRVRVEGLPPIDAVLDIAETDHVIRDTKTSTRTPEESAAETSLQLQQYALTYIAKQKRPPAAMVLDNLIYYKPSKKNPDGDQKYIPLTTHYSPIKAQAYLDRVVAVNAGIVAGIAIPADRASWKCSPRFCGFFGTTCKFTRGMLAAEAR